VSSKEHEWQCSSCGGRKQLFFLRKPFLVLFGALCLGIALLGNIYIENANLRLAVLFSGGLFGITIISSLLKIRCLNCEPEWVKKGIWGGTN